MAKLTVAEIKRQIAALESKAAQIAEQESKAAVAKVRSLMDSLGVTIEHLTAVVSKRSTSAKRAPGKKATPAKRAGAGVVRYRNPETGATWTGFGRAPAWIASAANREDFAVSKATGRASTKKAATAKTDEQPVTEVKAAAKKGASAVKRAAKKTKAAASAPAKKKLSAKSAPRKAVAKRTKAAAAAPAKKKASAKTAPRKAAAKKAEAAQTSEQATSSVEAN